MFTAAMGVFTQRPIRWRAGLQALLAIGLMVGCAANSPQNDQQVGQQAAQATAQVKQGAKQAGEQIKAGAAVAARKINDVAAGVKDGLNSPAPTGDSTSVVDINSATEADLITLPGVGAREADKIIRNRPYNRAHDLVKKGVLSETEFGRISSRVVVR